MTQKAVYGPSGFLRGHVDDLAVVAAQPRLFIYIPGIGFAPAILPGTAWDAAYWRMIYRARGVCTAWVKHAA